MKKRLSYLLCAAFLCVGLPAWSAEEDEIAEDELPNVLVVQEMVTAQDAEATEAYVIPLRVVQMPRNAEGQIDAQQLMTEVKKQRLVAKVIRVDSIPQEALSFFQEADQNPEAQEKQPNWGFYFNLGGARLNFGLYGRGYRRYYGYNPYDRHGYWSYWYRNRYYYYNDPYYHWYYKAGKDSARYTIYVMQQGPVPATR